MSRYDPLTKYLEGRLESEVPLTFQDVERILNCDLPPSARRHQPWWANTRTHSYADAWLRVGWKTSRVDLAGERVVFVRRRGGSGNDAPFASGYAKVPKARDISIDSSRLNPSATRLLEDYAEEKGCELSEAVVEVLNAMAVERRRRLIERFKAASPYVSGDSTDLIREDRDAR